VSCVTIHIYAAVPRVRTDMMAC